MARPTRATINSSALLYNLSQVKKFAPDKKIIAMVKANAYGCGMEFVAPVLEKKVYAFGVASIEEAMNLRNFCPQKDCILFQGIFNPSELEQITKLNLQCVIHERTQLNWILQNKLSKTLRVWVKIDTGMHRLGFPLEEVKEVIKSLQACPWINQEIGIMTHMACADDINDPVNFEQINKFQQIELPSGKYIYSLSNSAAIMNQLTTNEDVVRPGIMLYGVSPFIDKSASVLGLKPVISFLSKVTVIKNYAKGCRIGYGGSFVTGSDSKIAIIPAGYGDGYPRHIKNDSKVFIKNTYAPIVGRVSMDMMAIDVTNCGEVKVGDSVELWGENIPVEEIASSAGTIAYELICQLSLRVRRKQVG